MSRLAEIVRKPSTDTLVDDKRASSLATQRNQSIKNADQSGPQQVDDILGDTRVVESKVQAHPYRPQTSPTI